MARFDPTPAIRGPEGSACLAECAEMGSEEAFEITDLVIYQPADEDPTDLELVGLKEFQIAKALLDGHAAKLSQQIPSQWGDVRLFDVCLFLGFADTAWALVRYGVEGCQVEMHHLGPFSTRTFQGSVGDTGDGLFPCKSCCWGFPLDRGTWMPGWDYFTGDAVEAAKKVARKPWFPDLLDMVCSEQKLGFAVSAKAMARLLDIAILTGNKEAATVLASKCALLPLRWYSSAFFFHWRVDELQPFAIPILRAALAAGIDFSELSVRFRSNDSEWIPFSQALFLRSTSLWMELCGFLPPSPWRPQHLNSLADFFLERPVTDGFKLDAKKLQNAGKAEVDLRCIKMSLICSTADTGHSCYGRFLSLLDLAIVWGQPDCAEICASMDVKLTDFGLQLCWEALDGLSTYYVYSGPFQLNPLGPDACLNVARSAAISALRVAHKRHVTEKGFVLYQTLLKRFDPSPFPLWILDEILALSVRAPSIIEQLQLWEEVAGWDTEIKSQDMEADGGKAEVSMEQTALKSHGQQSGAIDTDDAVVADDKSTDGLDDLMMALQASRDEVPALNVDGVCIWRLTRQSKCAEVAMAVWMGADKLACGYIVNQQ